jgi:hypothetical protein
MPGRPEDTGPGAPIRQLGLQMLGSRRRALDRGSRYIATAQSDQPLEPEMTITIEYCTV